ncbi:MAG: GNAT family N-acetyltransferase [Pseudomonadota bacterium]
MSVVLRAAGALDAGAVGGILSEFIDETAWMPRLHSRAQDISFAGDMIARGWVQVAITRSGVAGFLARDQAEVHALYVARAARRCGVGAALLTAAQAHARMLRLWTFQANVGAQAFYAAHGFREVQRSDGSRNDEGLPDIELTWEREAA